MNKITAQGVQIAVEVFSGVGPHYIRHRGGRINNATVDDLYRLAAGSATGYYKMQISTYAYESAVPSCTVYRGDGTEMPIYFTVARLERWG